MESKSKDEFDDMFNLRKYMLVLPTEAGGDAFDLLSFLYDVRDLANYQAHDYGAKAKTHEEKEQVGEMVYTTKSIADNFLMVAPILLYRLTETYFKKYLLILYEATLTNTHTIRRGQSSTVEQQIMTANITTIKILYANSNAAVDITTLKSYDIIEELRELNNCLKHNHDYVNTLLAAKNPYWVEKELITVDKIQNRVADFDHGINAFFYDLVEKTKPFFPQ